MNKFILLALVATAFADKCATADKLNKANFEEYKLKYKLKNDYSDGDDLTKGTSISFDINDKTCGKDCWFIQTKENSSTTFRIKGYPATDKKSAGFQIYSEDENKVLSLKQGYGYYMYDKRSGYLKDEDSEFYKTLMNYHDDNNSLSQAQKSLGVFDSGNGTHIFQTGTYIFNNVDETKFCFVKVDAKFHKAFKAFVLDTGSEFAKGFYEKGMESLKDEYPVIGKLLNDGSGTFTKRAKTAAQKQLKELLTKALKESPKLLEDQLNIKTPKTVKEGIKMVTNLLAKSKGKKEKDEENSIVIPEENEEKDEVHIDFKDKKVHEHDDSEEEKNKESKKEEDQAPKFVEIRIEEKFVKSKKDGSSVQTPFALCSLVLLLLVH